MLFQSTMTRLMRKLRDFLRGEGGMTLPLTAMSMVVMTGLVGIGIDVGRLQMVQSKLQFSLDAAGLAAGSTVSTTSLNTEVAKYLNGNFNGYMGATLTGSSVTANSTNTQFNLSATATLPTTFLGVIGVNTMTTTANSQITRAVTGLELVLVLDNTGSMADSAGGSGSKIQALQSAATTLVNTLFAGNPATGKLWIGIVPFSQAVNIGTSHTAWMDSTYDNTLASMPASQGPGWGNTSWAGCVDARQSGYDVTDDPPSSGSTLFQQYYWPSDNLNYGSPYNNIPNYYYSTAQPTSITGTNENAWAKVATYKRCHGSSCTTVSGTCSTSGGYTCTPASYSYASNINTSNKGPNLLCPQQVTPMTNVQSTLTTAINGMVAQGDTVISEGMAWGWRMLSPRWQGQWGGTMNANNLPLAYNTPGMVKAVVLLTDGENTIDSLAHGAYWFLDNGRTGSTSSSTAVTDLDNKVLQICTAMKNNGIYIYTIGLGTDGGINTSELQSCATATNYYFPSPTTTQLQGVFSQIGDSLSNLRVSH